MIKKIEVEQDPCVACLGTEKKPTKGFLFCTKNLLRQSEEGIPRDCELDDESCCVPADAATSRVFFPSGGHCLNEPLCADLTFRRAQLPGEDVARSRFFWERWLTKEMSKEERNSLAPELQKYITGKKKVKPPPKSPLEQKVDKLAKSVGDLDTTTKCIWEKTRNPILHDSTIKEMKLKCDAAKPVAEKSKST